MVYVRHYDIHHVDTKMVNLKELTFSKRDRTDTLKHKYTAVQSKYIYLIFLHIISYTQSENKHALILTSCV